jgi:flagellar biosynthetic protein FlhB
MADQELDRNEAATPFKLQKAREQGQTPRSADFVSTVVFLSAMVYVAGQGMHTMQGLLQLTRSALVRAGDGTHAAPWPMVAQLISGAGHALLPMFLALVIAAIIGASCQTGMVFSLQPLQIDFDRLHPGQGIKRVMSLRTLFDGARACLKLTVLCGVAALALFALLPQFHAIASLAPAVFLQTLQQDVTAIGFKMGLGLLAISLLDMLFTRGEFARKMRMSRRELKDEYKQREGDPRIRGRMREIRHEMLKRSKALKNTSTADVVLTNPTHYAVALRYVHGEMEAPRVVAKGAGHLAAAMREIASRHRVVVVQNPPLARRLFREAALEEYIPASLHVEIARIIVWVLAARRQADRSFTGAAA